MYGILIVAQRAVIIIKIVAKKRAIYVKPRKFGLQTYGFVHVVECRRIVAVGVYGHVGSDKVCVDRAFVKVKRFFHVGDSPDGILLLQTQACAPNVSAIKSAVRGEQRIECGSSLVIPLQFLICESLVEQYHTVFRQSAEHFVIIVQRVFNVSDILVGHRAQLVGVKQKRILFDSCRCIGYSSAEIVEIVFGYRPEKIWLCEIRLGGNDLVEVLYRQHIVFEIKRVAPYLHHLVGIDLCVCRHIA